MPNQEPAVDRLFKALGDPTRRRMVEEMSRGTLAVSELARPFAMSLPAVLQHLNVLEQGGIVTTTKVGRVRTCRLRPDSLQVAQDWISARRASWEHRLDELARYLDESQHEGDG